jgi:Pvc16 N-terminal domain
MSNALAIAGVTAVLQYYLTNLYASPSVSPNFPSGVKVSCLAPDQVQSDIVTPGKTDTEHQVNLFLHQVTHNAAWRNQDFASMSSDGTLRLSNPPLALNLHYLLTAYGSKYWQSEALLGYALMMLHEAPVLTRQDITTAIQNLQHPHNALNDPIAFCGLADQIEMLKITPENLSKEEMAWLWTALKADYRVTFPFQVSVVLLQPTFGTSLALPVLQRVFGPAPTYGPVTMQTPLIASITTPSNQPGANAGDSVIVAGINLAGATHVLIGNAHFGMQPPIAIPPGSALADAVTFTVPAASGDDYPAGTYELEVQFRDSSGTVALQTTNSLPFGIAPTLPLGPPQHLLSTSTATSTTVTLDTFSPAILEGQTVQLALSNMSTPLVSGLANAQPYTAPATSLDFLFEPPLPTGVNLLARLQVDGISSIIQADLQVFPPVFTAPLVTL